MSKHTPGPWVVGIWEDTGGYDCIYSGVSVGPVRILGVEGVVTLCGSDYGEKSCEYPKEPPERMMEDARLIAAAPELLQAAMDAYELLKLIHDETGKVGTQLRAAIAKAKGESV